MNKKSLLFLIIVIILAVAAIIAGRAFFSGNDPGGETPTEPDPVTETDKPEKISRKVKLYFASEDGMSFKTEERVIESAGEKDLPLDILKELINGPQEAGVYPALNKSTEILGVEVKNKIADVRLGDNFISLNTGGSTKEFISVFSVVNTLTDLDEIEAVTFSYGGNPVYEFGSFYFDEPCVKKMSVNEL